MYCSRRRAVTELPQIVAPRTRSSSHKLEVQCPCWIRGVAVADRSPGRRKRQFVSGPCRDVVSRFEDTRFPVCDPSCALFLDHFESESWLDLADSHQIGELWIPSLSRDRPSPFCAAEVKLRLSAPHLSSSLQVNSYAPWTGLFGGCKNNGDYLKDILDAGDR